MKNEKMPTRDVTINEQSQQGFTLLETSIALIVMMVVTLATASLFVYAVKYNSGSGDRSAALAIAQQRLERLRRVSYTDALKNAGSTTETFVNAGRSYTVVTTICATSDCGGSATLKIITIAVTPVSVNSWANTPATVISERASPAVGQYAGV